MTSSRRADNKQNKKHNVGDVLFTCGQWSIQNNAKIQQTIVKKKLTIEGWELLSRGGVGGGRGGGKGCSTVNNISVFEYRYIELCL